MSDSGMKARLLPRGPALLVLFALLLAGFVSGCSPKWRNLTTEQKLEDFNYLFSVLEQNHPYLALKARAEGYDWLSHRQEFEQAVRASSDDKGFAQAIAWMLLQVNSGHTNISSWTTTKDMADWNEEPWKNAARQTSAARADYRYGLSYPAPDAGPKDGFPPFLAVYNGGQYVIAAVAPDEAIRRSVQPGMTVLEVEGLPVQEYVAGQRGLLPYRQLYDPVRKCLYQRQLVLPLKGEFLRVTLGDAAGQVTEDSVSYAGSDWDSAYPWPPLVHREARFPEPEPLH
jgi:hypothetical protein